MGAVNIPKHFCCLDQARQFDLLTSVLSQNSWQLVLFSCARLILTNLGTLHQNPL